MMCMLLSSVQLLASDFWYDQKLEGWYYFENPKSSKSKEEALTPEQAQQLIEQERRHLAQMLSLAIVNPTPQNVQNYMSLQKQWLNQSGRFATAWGKLLLEDPTLGDFLNNPTTSHGIKAKKHFDLQKRKKLLKDLSTEHFLVFFYRGEDIYSVQAARVIKLFAQINNWEVKAVSLDGKLLDTLPDSELDQGLSKSFGVKATPSMFVVDPYSDKIVPVGAGLVSVSQLEAQIESQFQEEDPNA